MCGLISSAFFLKSVLSREAKKNPLSIICSIVVYASQICANEKAAVCFNLILGMTVHWLLCNERFFSFAFVNEIEV